MIVTSDTLDIADTILFQLSILHVNKKSHFSINKLHVKINMLSVNIMNSRVNLLILNAVGRKYATIFSMHAGT